MSPPTDLTKGAELVQGKTKKVFALKASPHYVLVENKDRITANNAQICHDMEGKAHCSNVTNAAIFEYLDKTGLPTSFVRSLDATNYLARSCRMIPLEWVTRRIATGSFLKRNPGVEEGYRFSPVKIETFFKDDAAGDPEWSKAQVLSCKMEGMQAVVTEVQYDQMYTLTKFVFEVLERAWATLGSTLIDMKIEFGFDCETGEIILSDVIDNDSWRLWEGGMKDKMKDKQIYRNLKDFTDDDMKKVKVSYDWVKEKVATFSSTPTCTVVILMGSAADKALSEDVKRHCESLGLNVVRRVMSAHKVTQETLNTVAYYNSLSSPCLFIAIAGRSNGLGPVVSANTSLPVINCPPVKKTEQSHDIWSSLSVPSGLGCSTVIYPEAAALHAASIFALQSHAVWGRVRWLQAERGLKLARDDLAMTEGDKEN